MAPLTNVVRQAYLLRRVLKRLVGMSREFDKCVHMIDRCIGVAHSQKYLLVNPVSSQANRGDGHFPGRFVDQPAR
jgi:hypothetical protein